MEEEKVEMVSFMRLFRFATKFDLLLIFIGIVSACAHGLAQPSMIIVLGSMTDTFVQDAKDSAITRATGGNAKSVADDIVEKIGAASLKYSVVASILLVVCYIRVAALLTTSIRQTHRVRIALLSAVLRQDISWYDTHDPGEINTRLTDDVVTIQEGIGDKLGNFFQWTSTFVGGTVIAFMHGWKMAIVISCTTPLLAICAAFMNYVITTTTKKELNAYAKAGAVAQEALSSIRIVIAFGGQDKECERYKQNLGKVRTFGIRKGALTGIGMGFMYVVIFSAYALAFWYGGKLIREDPVNYSIGTVVIILFCVLASAFALGNAFPNLENIGSARAAAVFIWNLVDRKPPIDSSSELGVKPVSLIGNIEFKDIVFRYPAREDVPILNGFTCLIKPGQTVAFVGSSGCGKSTLIQLIQRFYDPLFGNIFLDGRDLKEYRIKWLRQHIGVVGQEPVLFAMTIADNIRYGRDDVTMAEIEQATKEANAYDFISLLPQKFETMVGERGAQLSGGQKQRIAIARALVRDPRILLLDEATSALDTESEATVQAALEKARQGRTTLVVAHRLSTIKTADIIYGIHEGIVKEIGTHDELMMIKGGIYRSFVNNQKLMEGDEDASELGLNNSNTLNTVVCGKSHTSLAGKESVMTIIDDQKLPKAPLTRILALNRPEWYIMLAGCIVAAGHGCVQPTFAVIFSSILNVFSKDNETQKREVFFYSMIFLGIGGAAAILRFLQALLFSISGEVLTMRVREKTFKTLLGQDVAYFDDIHNSTGALTTRLATDASAMQYATGAFLGILCQSISCLGLSVAIAFIYSWQLALLIIGFIPLLFLAFAAQFRLAKGFSSKGNENLEDAGKIATEAILNIRTVASLTREPKFIEEYDRLVSIPYLGNLKNVHVIGIAFGLSQSIIFYAYATVFYVGAVLIRDGKLDYEELYRVFSSILFGAMAIGLASQFAGDHGKAKTAAARIFKLWDTVPAINSYSTNGSKPSSCSGTVEFKNVQFSYPMRPTVTVLNNLNVKVEQGQMIGIVGSSGCGKSTAVQLLERFYEVSEGSICIDENPVPSLNISWLRAQIGVVSQEPVLFDRSIRDNIAYGDNTRENINIDEIVEAARAANIHSFIANLPLGYDTGVGSMGAQLSGGQKQRIAIARALLRNPKILLLDEATSALDTESEKVVQEALDRAQQGRTCIAIAHRLSTIQNADCIFVFSNGIVAEKGTHSQLIGLKGLYYRLSAIQQARKNF